MFPAWNSAGKRRRVALGKLLRASLSGALIAAFVVVAAGVPLPTGKRVAKSGERFPCELCACGCGSAEHCWRSCCCHTLAERLAWAEENGVTPPAFALAAAKADGLDSGGRTLTTKTVNVAIAKPSCCREKHECCHAAATSGCCAHRDSADNGNSSHRIVAWRALGCRGQSLNWLAAVPTLVRVEHQLSDQLPLVTWLGPLSSEIAGGVADVPTPPPPERA